MEKGWEAGREAKKEKGKGKRGREEIPKCILELLLFSLFSYQKSYTVIITKKNDLAKSKKAKGNISQLWNRFNGNNIDF